MLREASLVVAATDSDREGEHIFRLIYQHSGSRAPIQRLWISSLTEEAIREGFAGLLPREQFDPLAAAARARSHADWLVGLNCTRAYTLLNGDKCTIGRVQTPTLALIVNRHNEIANFKSVPFAEIGVTLAPGFRARLLHDGKPRIDDLAQARSHPRGDHSAPHGHRDERRDEGDAHPGSPALQPADAAEGSQQALGLHGGARPRARPGALRGEGAHVSPHRQPLPLHETAAAASEAPRRPGCALRRPGCYGSRRRGRAASSSARATSTTRRSRATTRSSRRPQVPPADLPADQRNIYDLVARRFVAIFLPPRLSDDTTALFALGAHTLRATGSVLKSPGWTIIDLPAGAADDEGDAAADGDDKQTLPPLQGGQVVPKLDQKLVEKKTTPPKPYTDATLLDAMKNAGRLVDDADLAALMKQNGLGTPATRASIIEKLVDVGYIERRKKAIQPTEKAIALIAQVAAPLRDPILTAQWEQQLADIEDGKTTAPVFEQSIVAFLKTLVPQILSATPLATSNLGACPTCKTGVVGPTPKGWGCSRYRDGCKFAIWEETAGVTITEDAVKALLTGGTAQLAKPRPATLTLTPEDRVNVAFTALGSCPMCKQGTVASTPKGWGCSRYREGCKFVIWKEVAGKKLTDAVVQELLSSRVTKVLKGFKSKSGNPFNAKLRLDDAFKVTFEFEPAKQ